MTLKLKIAMVCLTLTGLIAMTQASEYSVDSMMNVGQSKTNAKIERFEQKLALVNFDMTKRNHFLRARRIAEHIENAKYYSKNQWTRKENESIRLAKSILEHHANQGTSTNLASI